MNIKIVSAEPALPCFYKSFAVSSMIRLSTSAVGSPWPQKIMPFRGASSKWSQAGQWLHFCFGRLRPGDLHHPSLMQTGVFGFRHGFVPHVSPISQWMHSQHIFFDLRLLIRYLLSAVCRLQPLSKHQPFRDFAVGLSACSILYPMTTKRLPPARRCRAWHN